MHIGQAADLEWTHSRHCPTVEEYKIMVQNSETNPPSITYPTVRFELTAAILRNRGPFPHAGRAPVL
jgi:hypothetical protein